MRRPPTHVVLLVAALAALAVLAILGRSLVMLTSVGGFAVGLWLARRRPLGHRLLAVLVGAVLASLLAEAVHVLWHRALGDQPDQGGFWVSALFVGSINAAAMAPVVWLTERGRRRG